MYFYIAELCINEKVPEKIVSLYEEQIRSHRSGIFDLDDVL